MSVEVRIPLASAEKGMHVFLDRQREAATNCPPLSSWGMDIVPGMSLCSCTVKDKNTLTSPSLSMTSPALSERLSYFVQIRGQTYDSGEAAQHCTLPSLQTFYKGLARELLDCSACRNGCVAWDSGWGWLEKVDTLCKNFPTVLKIQNTHMTLQMVYGASEALVEMAELHSLSGISRGDWKYSVLNHLMPLVRSSLSLLENRA